MATFWSGHGLYFLSGSDFSFHRKKSKVFDCSLSCLIVGQVLGVWLHLNLIRVLLFKNRPFHDSRGNWHHVKLELDFQAVVKAGSFSLCLPSHLSCCWKYSEDYRSQRREQFLSPQSLIGWQAGQDHAKLEIISLAGRLWLPSVGADWRKQKCFLWASLAICLSVLL